MINLPYNLGIIARNSISEYRKKHNIPIPPELGKIYNPNMQFLDDELSLVTEINLDKTSIGFVNLFPNVTSVTIDGSNELDQAAIVAALNQFPNLESLIIQGQDGLQYLDVGKLTKLKDLRIISNRGLHNVVGIDKLSELSNFVFYDNQTYYKISELCKLVDEMSRNGIQCDLDVLYMPDIMQVNQNFDSINLTWSEAVGLGLQGKKLQYTKEELMQAVEKAKTIIDTYIRSTDSPIQTYAILYQWMCDNIRYDFDALDNKNTRSVNGENQGVIGGTNGTVNGLVYGHCVCEGYSKSMQLLLKLCGIPSFDVGCIAENRNVNNPLLGINIDGKKKTNQGDHSIIKVNLDGKVYYSDITWDAGNFQRNQRRNYFLLSKQDMQKDHKLIDEEQVFTAPVSITPENQQILLAEAKNRIISVDEERKKQTSKPRENTEVVAEVNQSLILKRQSYDIIARQMEELMNRNQRTPILNYDQKLAMLIQQKDKISECIDQLMSYQATLQSSIKYEAEKKLKAALLQVERLLNIRITSTKGYIVNPNEFGGVPQIVSKDTIELSKEQGIIMQQLNDLWMDGELDIRTSNALKNAVRTIYQQLISVAPKPIIDRQTKTNLQEISNSYQAQENEVEELTESQEQGMSL